MRKKLRLLNFGLMLGLVVIVMTACKSSDTATTIPQAAPTAIAQVVTVTVAAVPAAATSPGVVAPAATTVAAAAAVTTTAAAAAPAGDPLAGEQTFKWACSRCHPNGGTVAGTVASGKQPPVLNTAAIMGNPTLIRNRIRNGAGGLPTLAEPSFSPTQIRESELNDLVAFLTAPRAAGFVPPTATPLATAIVPAPTATALPVIPIPSNAAGVALTGSASRGEAIFRRGCEVCHANGGRARGPLDQPNLSTNGNTWSPAFVRPWILNGSDRGMPAWKDILNAQEVEDLVRYINIINTFQKPSPAPAVTTVAPTATP